MAKTRGNSPYHLKSVNRNKYLYTKGYEYSLDGENYVGEYHIIGETAYTGPEQSTSSKQLRRYYTNKDLYAYDKARNFQTRVRVEPDQHVFTPNESDYLAGFVNRYFVERVGKFEGYPLEIEKRQASGYGKIGGIDEGAYNLVSVKWLLVGVRNSYVLPNGVRVEGVYDHNYREILLATKIIPNLQEAIKNYLEFVRLLSN